MGKKSTVLTALRKCRYLGSHPAASGQVDKVDIEFLKDGIRFACGRHNLGLVAWSAVRELRADTRESLERRFGLTMAPLLGAIVLLAKQTVSYLVITDNRGDWVFAVPRLSSVELESGLRSLQQFVPRNETPDPPSAANPIQVRLQQLEELRRSGLVTDVEYTERRASILNDL